MNNLGILTFDQIQNAVSFQHKKRKKGGEYPWNILLRLTATVGMKINNFYKTKYHAYLSDKNKYENVNNNRDSDVNCCVCRMLVCVSKGQ